MQYEEKECLQCEKLFEGRANKKFCSDTCRAQYHRDNLATDNSQEEDWEDDESDPEEGSKTWQTKIPLLDEDELATPRVSTSEEVERAKSIYDVEVLRLEQYKLLMQRKKEAEKAEAEEDALEEINKENNRIKGLHALYSKLIKKCLKMEGHELEGDDLEAWIEELDEASEEYQSHPGLRNPDDKAHRRLKDLYWCRDTFSGWLDKLREQEDSYFMMVEPVFLDLPPKRKAHFRENLIG